MAHSETVPLRLVNIGLDLQITICTFLHPSDILALRQTCKAFQLPTRQRVVWVDALRRVCHDNTLFLPSFPIPDMTVLELEHAAMVPRRWIELCAAFQKQHPNDSGAKLCSRTTRIIDNPLAAMVDTEIFIVPGGRYLISHSYTGIFVWDLGYTSSADCKLIASVAQEVGSDTCTVQATPDGLGLIIFSSHPCQDCSIYEIYPQNETPQLTQIAHVNFDASVDLTAYLLPDRVIWCGFCEDRLVFRVWDFRGNYSTSFSADVDMPVDYSLEVIVTKTAIIVLCIKGILVWAIPPLSLQSPDFFDHNPTHIPSLFRIPLPDGILHHTDIVVWKTVSSWYFGSSQPLYFDISCPDSKFHRFKIIVKPNLYDTSLHVINTSTVNPHYLDDYDLFLQPYSICEDTLVACWDNNDHCGVYTGLTSSRFSNVMSYGGPLAKMLLPATGNIYSLCPASGKFVHLDLDNNRILVDDFF
ncbi:hypothetical protein BYT27DRAFT_7142220 [Phlegmacium glaucopus]|nr:hypothetical protein BYT27DRAFT_7142220 [Phlegmacium glaucopus]